MAPEEGREVDSGGERLKTEDGDTRQRLCSQNAMPFLAAPVISHSPLAIPPRTLCSGCMPLCGPKPKTEGFKDRFKPMKTGRAQWVG